MTVRFGWIVLFALVLRLVAALAVQSYLDEVAHREFLIPGDANGYWELGCKLARGEDFSIYEPPRRLMRMPGFPVLLSGSVLLFGESLFAARCVLAGVGALACGLVYQLGRLMFDEPIGTLAGCFAAVSPVLIGFSVEILSETAFGAALVGSLILFALLMRGRWLPVGTSGGSTIPVASPMPRPRVALAIFAGFGVALATYFRPTWLLAAPIFGACHVGCSAWRAGQLSSSEHRAPQKQACRHAACEALLVFVGLTVAMAPWTYRNWAVSGHWIPTTLWFGPSLYDGLHPHATGDSDMQFFEDDRLLATMSEYEMDREYRRRSWAFVAAQPLRAIELGFIKLKRFWSPYPNADQFRYWWLCVGMGSFFVVTMGTAVVGCWKLRCEPAACLLTLGPILYFAAVHAVFVGSVRYRLPAEYPLFVMSAVGAVALRNRFYGGGRSC